MHASWMVGGKATAREREREQRERRWGRKAYNERVFFVDKASFLYLSHTHHSYTSTLKMVVMTSTILNMNISHFVTSVSGLCNYCLLD